MAKIPWLSSFKCLLLTRYISYLSYISKSGVQTSGVQKHETAAMLVSHTNPMRIELLFCVDTFFRSNKFAWLLATRGKTLYSCRYLIDDLSGLTGPDYKRDHHYKWIEFYRPSCESRTS